MSYLVGESLLMRLLISLSSYSWEFINGYIIILCMMIDRWIIATILATVISLCSESDGNVQSLLEDLESFFASATVEQNFD